MTETLAHGYSSESTQCELSNEYQHDRVLDGFQKSCILVLWLRVALGGLGKPLTLRAMVSLRVNCMITFKMKSREILALEET